MHGVYHLLRTALCPMRPRSDLSFRTVITIRPAVVSDERCHVSHIENSCIDLSLSCPNVLTRTVTILLQDVSFCGRIGCRMDQARDNAAVYKDTVAINIEKKNLRI